MAKPLETLNTLKDIGFQGAASIGTTWAANKLVSTAIRKSPLGASKMGTRIISERLLKLEAKALQKGIMKKIEAYVFKKVTGAILKQTVKGAGVSVAKSMAKEAAMAGTVVAVGCATTAAETAGIGCAVSAVIGLAIEAISLVSDVINIILSVTDKLGLAFVMDKAYIEEIRKHFEESMDAAFTKYGFPAYYTETINFDPLLFIYSTDEKTGVVTENQPYASQFYAFQDEYMASIGVTGDWRARVAKSEDTKTYDPMKSMPDAQEYVDASTESEVKWGWLIGGLVLLLVCIIIYISSRNEQ